MAHSSGQSLTETLVLALTQCQEQTRILRDQSERIDRLQKQNDDLRKELDNVNQRQGTTMEDGGDQSGFHDLFKQNIEYRAEIQILKHKLKSYKEKANRRLSVPISSPISMPTTPKTTLGKKAVGEGEIHSSRPKKRQRTGDRAALQALSPNQPHSRSPSTASKSSVIDKQISAIPLLAEDGKNVVTGSNNSRTPIVTQENSIYKRRLDGLLNGPQQNKSPLGRSTSTSPRKGVVGSDRSRRTPRISNIDHVSAPVTTIAPVRNEPQPELMKMSSSGSKQVSGGRFGLRKLDGKEGQVQPLRVRPLSTLSLQDFRPNPKWVDEHGMACDDFMKGSNGERVRALAATLPKMPGQHERQLSDNDLLIEFLGCGSEANIEDLTDVARRNLLEEARIMHVAQAFGKQRVDYDRNDDAPGFWCTDMPGTQEEQENRVNARKMVEAEVRRRREVALAGNGRWVFADEISAH